jgi:hypothetical protein
MTSEEILKTEYSEEFDEIRKKAMVMGHYKYGSIKANRDAKATDMIKSIEMRLEKYKNTHNTEYLADIANFAMIEFMYPSFEDGRFEYTDSDKSPGLYGLSVKEMERYKELKARDEESDVARLMREYGYKPPKGT